VCVPVKHYIEALVMNFELNPSTSLSHQLFLSQGLRAVLYLFGLLWTFLGVGIIADVFMGAIEVGTI
jgi:hypothetical protein